MVGDKGHQHVHKRNKLCACEIQTTLVQSIEGRWDAYPPELIEGEILKGITSWKAEKWNPTNTVFVSTKPTEPK